MAGRRQRGSLAGPDGDRAGGVSDARTAAVAGTIRRTRRADLRSGGPWGRGALGRLLPGRRWAACPATPCPGCCDRSTSAGRLHPSSRGECCAKAPGSSACCSSWTRRASAAFGQWRRISSPRTAAIPQMNGYSSDNARWFLASWTQSGSSACITPACSRLFSSISCEAAGPGRVVAWNYPVGSDGGGPAAKHARYAVKQMEFTPDLIERIDFDLSFGESSGPASGLETRLTGGGTRKSRRLYRHVLVFGCHSWPALIEYSQHICLIS